jgi:hypothetical protein
MTTIQIKSDNNLDDVLAQKIANTTTIYEQNKELNYKTNEILKDKQLETLKLDSEQPASYHDHFVHDDIQPNMEQQTNETSINSTSGSHYHYSMIPSTNARIVGNAPHLVTPNKPIGDFHLSSPIPKIDEIDQNNNATINKDYIFQTPMKNNELYSSGQSPENPILTPGHESIAKALYVHERKGVSYLLIYMLYID